MKHSFGSILLVSNEITGIAASVSNEAKPGVGATTTIEERKIAVLHGREVRVEFPAGKRGFRREIR